MDKKYVNIGLPEDKLIEECAEVIQALIKIKRFGIDSINPLTNISNLHRIKSELADLEYAIDKYRDTLKVQEIQKEINHEYEGYLGAKVYSVENNKIKCMAHQRYFHKIYYKFKFFEIDIDNKNVSAISEDFSFTQFDGVSAQYPHFINKIDGKTIMSVGIEDRTSYLLELKEIY